MTWREFVYKLITQHCAKTGSQRFTLKEFQKENEIEIAGFSDVSKTPIATVRRVLQELRNAGLLVFEGGGNYVFRTQDLFVLDAGADDENLVEIVKSHPPEKREYVCEVFVRDVAWVKEAKEVFGFRCLFHQCENSFVKEDGTPYIEVHHINPLSEGGEHGIKNLSVVCAHHHRMAHYADVKTRESVKDFLMRENSKFTV
ncbi:MAG: HNH endonuclease [Candidatus Dadabacteria bacterium]|nr:HNH endonuclease [Candidatus Dadabacteria bacterium]